jgi:hypothetical protein
MGMLHAQGQYFHYTSPRFPGKVLCFHKDSEIPADCVPTAAQEHFLSPAAENAQATG